MKNTGKGMRMMVSRTKPELNTGEIQDMFSAACLGVVLRASKLSDGEYNGVYDVVTDMGEYVLKVAPPDKTGILTYEQDMMRSEVFWYAQIRANTKIKVPYVYYKGFSHKQFKSDFFIMEKMDGEQLNNAKLSAEEKIWCEEEIAKITAQMHKVTNNEYGYVQNKLYDNWCSALKAMTQNLIYDAKRVNKKSKRGNRLLIYIDKYKDILEKVPCSMVNFDLWYGNILFVRGEKKPQLVIIDPERTMWGDAIFDFVNLDSVNELCKKTRTLKAYNETAKAKINCTEEEEIRFAFGLAYIGLIMETEKYYRYTLHHFGWWRNVAASAFFFKRAFKILKKKS